MSASVRAPPRLRGRSGSFGAGNWLRSALSSPSGPTVSGAEQSHRSVAPTSVRPRPDRAPRSSHAAAPWRTEVSAGCVRRRARGGGPGWRASRAAQPREVVIGPRRPPVAARPRWRATGATRAWVRSAPGPGSSGATGGSGHRCSSARDTGGKSPPVAPGIGFARRGRCRMAGARSACPGRGSPGLSPRGTRTSPRPPALFRTGSNDVGRSGSFGARAWVRSAPAPSPSRRSSMPRRTSGTGPPRRSRRRRGRGRSGGCGRRPRPG